MLLFDVIKNNVTTPYSPVTYETKKCSPPVPFRSVSCLLFESMLLILRARISLSVVKSLSKSCENRSAFGGAEYSLRDRNFSFPLLYICLLLFTLLLPFQQALTAPQISIVWGTTTNASSSDVLKGFDGLPLSAGVQGNGDGDLVELGYFSEATVGSPFSGTWIPLTKQTKVGDSSSGYGFGNGMFIFTSNFIQNSDQVVVFPTEPKEYSEDIGFTITSSTPPTGTPFCIRFYDGPQKGEARYNTVTGDNWLWPAFPNGSSIPSNFYIKIASGFAPAGSSWKYGSTFEDNDPADRFKTTIIPQYTIGVAISDYSNGQGSVTDINGSYGWGDTVNLAATPAPHSAFMGWIGEGIAETWNQNTTLTVNGDQTVYAEFFAIPYQVNLEAQGDGSVHGSGSFVHNDVVSINAYPNVGHSFVRWEKDGESFSNSAEETLTVEGDTNLTAVFARNQYQVYVGATEGGSYEILDEAGSIVSNPLSHGFGYILRAMPDPHYGFSSWASTPSGLSMLGNKSFAQTSFIPTADVNYTAIFSELFYKLNIESTQGYSSLSASGSFPALSMVPVQVKAAKGFVFDYWLDPMGILLNQDNNATEANMSLLFPYEEATISAILRLDDYTDADINITSEFGGHLSFESDPTGGFTHFNTYDLNATATLGYQFDQWIGDTEQLQYGKLSPSNKILIEGPLSLKATYKLTEFKLNLSATEGGSTIGPEGFTINSATSIKANAFPGWEFSHWTGDIDFLLDNTSSETLVQIESNSVPKDLTFTANFTPHIYNFALNTEGNGSVDILLSNGDTFYKSSGKLLTTDSQTQITIEALPDHGWGFSRWSGLPDISELSNPLAYINPLSSYSFFYPSKDLNITAYFEAYAYNNQEIIVNASGGGDVFLMSEENGEFLHFSSYNLKATPHKGYYFSKWIVDPSKSTSLLNGINNADNILKVDGNIEINATFSVQTYELVLGNSEGGYATGPTSYTIFESPLIQAISLEGWEFSYWSGDTQYLSDINAQETLVNHADLELKDLNLTANFSRKIYEVSLNVEGLGSIDVLKENNYIDKISSPQSVQVDSATRITLHATPSTGWKFSNWFGLPDPNELNDPAPSLNPSSSSVSFIPSSEANLTAQFVRQNYILQTQQAEFGGSVTNGGLFSFESIVEINASAQEHYNFYQWSGDTEYLIRSVNDPINQIRIPDSNLTIQPIFKPKIYTLTTNPSTGGYFEISGTYRNITLINQSEYNATSSITLSALPNNSDEDMLDYLYWENSLGENGYQYTSTFTIPFLDSNYSFWASFVPRNDIGYFLYSTPPYAGTAGVDTAHSTAQFQKLIATPNTGFSFIGWSSETGNSFSPNWAVHSVDSNLNDNDKIWAHFAPKSNFVSLEYDNSKGSISGHTEETDFGDYLNLTATPNENYAFSGWGLSKEVNFIVTKDSSTVDPEFSRLYINQKESPELSLIRGFTYRFNCNLDDGDEFFLSTSPNGHDTDAAYRDGVNGDLTSNGVLTFFIPSDAPEILYYHNSKDSYSGNLIRISTITDISLLSNTSNPVISQRVTQSFGLKADFERTRHSINVSSIGEGDVSHTTQDVYFWGDNINISATPKSHWYFSHWEGNANVLNSNSQSTVMTISNENELRAVFKKVQYNIDVTSHPTGYGFVNSTSETFNHGDFVTLTANPQVGKQFEEWVEIENLSLNNPDERFEKTATFQVLGNGKVKARFSKIPINIDIEIVALDQDDNPFPNDIGATITKPSSVYYGDTVNLKLNLLEGFNFLHWIDLDTGLNISSQSTLSFTANTDRKLKVVLRKLHYQLNLVQTIGGITEVNTNPPFYWMDQVKINAYPDEHWELFRWTGSENLLNAYSPSTTLAINRDTTLQAEFKKREYTLTVNESPEGYGAFSSLDNTYNFEDTVTILATPRTGKLFDKWVIDDNVSLLPGFSEASNPASFIIRGNAKITANFKSKIYSFSYQVKTVNENNIIQSGVFGGRVFVKSVRDPQGRLRPVPEDNRLEDEDVAEFTVSLANGFRLKHWQIEDGNPDFKPTETIYKHEMLSDLNLSAVVTNRKYKVELNVIPKAGGTASLNDEIISDHFSNSSYSYADNIELKAFPKPGFRFVEWATLGANLPLANALNQSINIGNNLNITAYFAPIGKINLSLLSSPIEAASDLYGGGLFNYDPAHAIFTSPKNGFIFSHWDYNGSLAEGVVRDPYSPNTSARLDGNIVLTAVFITDTNNTNPKEDTGEKYLLSVYSSNPSHGTTKGSGFFRGSREIQAFPKEDYQFSHWEGGNPSNVNSPFTTINVLSDTSVVAHFKNNKLVIEPEKPEEEKFLLLVSAENANHGTTSGSGSFTKGIRTIQAFPKSGFQFSHWEGGIFTNEYSSLTEINLLTNLTIIAYFQKVGIFDDSEVLDNGWWGNPWFGYFWKVGEDDWLFHEKLGWIFLKKKGDSSIWVWIQKMNGWFWTAKEHYPYLHSSSTQTWYWINLDNSDFTKLVIYDYASSKWLSLE